jgi:hypothetical protein
MNEAPKRACILKLEIGGDSRAEILRALNDVFDGVNDGRTNAVCGSPGYGYTLKYSESESPTHREYHEQLRAYIDARHAEGKTATNTNNGESK